MAEINSLVNLVEIKELVLNFLESTEFIKEVDLNCGSYLQKSRQSENILPIFFVLKVNFQEVLKKS